MICLNDQPCFHEFLFISPPSVLSIFFLLLAKKSNKNHLSKLLQVVCYAELSILDKS